MPLSKSSRTTASRITMSSFASKSAPNDDDDGNEDQILGHISVPEDGGWGWLVVVFVFLNLFILDGTVFTFGIIMPDIVSEMKETQTSVVCSNSIAVALYYLAGPFAASIINNHGFRACSMGGSVISCVALCCASYLATSIYLLLLLYGAIAGIGYSLICMSSSLVVGFYFEKNRALAYTIASMGTGAGVLSFTQINNYLLSLTGWRTIVLIHSVLMGMIYFFSMSFRPLKSVQVIATVDVGNAMESTVLLSRKSQRFSAGGISNMHYPTVADVIEESVGASGSVSPGPSSIRGASALSLVRRSQGTQNTIINLGSIKSSTLVMNQSSTSVREEDTKKTCCGRLCHWDHKRKARPMYRDDAFYQGTVTKLPQYERYAGTDPREKSGLEYQLAVSRAATGTDFKDKRTICSAAVRRILNTMLDPSLLRRHSFVVICVACMFIYMGYLVPYVYLQERSAAMGVPYKHESIFMCVVGLSNALGRPILGILANSLFDSVRLTAFLVVVAGVSTMMSGITYDINYQYSYCIIFGFSIGSIQCLKSLMIVSLYGLDKLTNAMGVIYLFQGVGSLFGSPMAAQIIENYGFDWAFYVSGGLVLFGGLLLFSVKFIAKREKVSFTM